MSGHERSTEVLNEAVAGLRPEGFVTGVDPAMQSLEHVTVDVAGTNIPILLTGESGVGKEAHARHIHRLSGRPAESFYKVHCAAMNGTRFAEVLAEAGEAAEAAHAGTLTLFFDEV